MWTLVDLVAGVGLLLDWFDRLGVGRLLLRFDHVGRAGLGGRREAAQRGQRRRAVGVQALGLELGFGQEHLSPLHLLLQLVVVWLSGGIGQCQQAKARGGEGHHDGARLETHNSPSFWCTAAGW